MNEYKYCYEFHKESDFAKDYILWSYTYRPVILGKIAALERFLKLPSKSLELTPSSFLAISRKLYYKLNRSQRVLFDKPIHRYAYFTDSIHKDLADKLNRVYEVESFIFTHKEPSILGALMEINPMNSILFDEKGYEITAGSERVLIRTKEPLEIDNNDLKESDETSFILVQFAEMQAIEKIFADMVIKSTGE